MTFIEKLKESGSMGFGTALTLIFVVLKLTGFIAWPWWWVATPILIEFVGALFVFLGVLLVSSKQVKEGIL